MAALGSDPADPAARRGWRSARGAGRALGRAVVRRDRPPRLRVEHRPRLPSPLSPALARGRHAHRRVGDRRRRPGFARGLRGGARAVAPADPDGARRRDRAADGLAAGLLSGRRLLLGRLHRGAVPRPVGRGDLRGPARALGVGGGDRRRRRADPQHGRDRAAADRPAVPLRAAGRRCARRPRGGTGAGRLAPAPRAGPRRRVAAAHPGRAGPVRRLLVDLLRHAVRDARCAGTVRARVRRAALGAVVRGRGHRRRGRDADRGGRQRGDGRGGPAHAGADRWGDLRRGRGDRGAAPAARGLRRLRGGGADPAALDPVARAPAVVDPALRGGAVPRLHVAGLAAARPPRLSRRPRVFALGLAYCAARFATWHWVA